MYSTPHSKRLREMVCQLRMQLSSVNLNQQTAMVTGPPLVHAVQSLRPHSEVEPPGGEHVIQLIRSGGRRLSVWRQSVSPVHFLGLAPLLGSVGPVAGDVKLQDDGVMDHPVNRRGGGHGVGKDALPLREDQV